MATIEDYGVFETAWCPGCGNFGIRKALIKALVDMDLMPHEICMVSGIGQAAKMPHYLKCNAFNGLHGRSVPAATGVKMANPDLVVIAESGDGCHYGEGGNHFMAACRRNPNITIIAHDNQVYGLTKGQASPTSQRGFTTKAQPHGSQNTPFNPMAAAVAMRVGYVARGFAGKTDHLAELIKGAISHQGLSLVDVLQPCVSFNKINTHKWYQDRVYEIQGKHDPSDWAGALELSREFGDRIPIGVLYQTKRKPFGEHLPALEHGPLATEGVNLNELGNILEAYK